MTKNGRTFRKLDRWIGRHMKAERWIIVYLLITCGGVFLAAHGWWALLGIPMVIIGLLGIIGHTRRLL